MNYVPVTDGVICDDDIFFYSDYTNGLYKMNVDRQNTFFCGEVPGGIWGESDGYCAINMYKNIIILVPFNADFLILFNRDNGNYESITIPKNISINGGYIANCVCDRYLFMFGGYFPEIIRIDMECGEIFELKNWEKQIRQAINDDVFFRQQVLVLDGIIYAPFCNNNGMMIIDARTLEYEIVELGRNNNCYAGIAFCNGKLWLAPRKLGGDAVSYDLETKEIEKYSLFSQDTDRQGTYIGAVSVEDEKVIFYASSEMVGACIEGTPITIQEGRYAFVNQKGNKILCFSRTSNSIEILTDGRISFSEVVNIKNVDNCLYRADKSMVLAEDVMMDLNNLLDYVSDC